MTNAKLYMLLHYKLLHMQKEKSMSTLKIRIIQNKVGGIPHIRHSVPHDQSEDLPYNWSIGILLLGYMQLNCENNN